MEMSARPVCEHSLQRNMADNRRRIAGRNRRRQGQPHHHGGRSPAPCRGRRSRRCTRPTASRRSPLDWCATENELNEPPYGHGERQGYSQRNTVGRSCPAMRTALPGASTTTIAPMMTAPKISAWANGCRGASLVNQRCTNAPVTMTVSIGPRTPMQCRQPGPPPSDRQSPAATGAGGRGCPMHPDHHRHRDDSARCVGRYCGDPVEQTAWPGLATDQRHRQQQANQQANGY